MDTFHTIKRIYDKITHQEYSPSEFALEKTVSPSSGTKLPAWRFFHNGSLVRKHNSLMVVYACKTCQRENIVCLNNIVRKINNSIVCCNTCKNQQAEKTQAQSEYMKRNAPLICRGVHLKHLELDSEAKPSLKDKLNRDEEAFHAMDTEFQDAYHRTYMNREEFERICSKIVSFQGDKFSNMGVFQYYPYVSIPHYCKFHPYLYDTSRDVLEKVVNVKFKCENCDATFVNKDLRVQKNKYKIYCQDCNFSNNTFKIRNTQNYKGERVTYQSGYELKFVQYCNAHQILIENGPKIQYQMENGRTHRYIIDFTLPEHSLLVELKDGRHCGRYSGHHWHEKQVASGKGGKWAKKEAAAKEYAQQHNMEYVMIFPKHYTEFCKKLGSKVKYQDKI
jgi:hypothetical protein